MSNILSEIKKVKDQFFLKTLEKCTDSKSAIRLYLIYRILNVAMLWGTIIVFLVSGSTLFFNVLSKIL